MVREVCDVPGGVFREQGAFEPSLTASWFGTVPNDVARQSKDRADTNGFRRQRCIFSLRVLCGLEGLLRLGALLFGVIEERGSGSDEHYGSIDSQAHYSSSSHELQWFYGSPGESPPEVLG